MPLSKGQRRLLFQMLGGFLFLIGTLLIIVFNYLMVYLLHHNSAVVLSWLFTCHCLGYDEQVHPFIVPIGWALCSSLAMRPMNRAILASFAWYSELSWKIRAMFVASVWSTYFYWLAWVSSFSFALFALPHLASRRWYGASGHKSM
jgi:hypothetical protein